MAAAASSKKKKKKRLRVRPVLRRHSDAPAERGAKEAQTDGSDGVVVVKVKQRVKLLSSTTDFPASRNLPY